eukprot:GILI01005866.1.p1 GENE.GILI01005866.1~~GILI01005866.1.p1  ORF type:complete len:633 (-),score=211.40 GILI01005866.1:70-1920(-)
MAMRPQSRSGAVPLPLGAPLPPPGTAMRGLPPKMMMPPGTAARGVPGPLRPGTRSGMPPGTAMMEGLIPASVGIATDVQVDHRPVTQQGMKGMKTGNLGPGRQVYDKSFYVGQLRAKNIELNNETNMFRQKIDQIQKDNNSYAQLEKRYETLLKEVRNLEGDLADYNLALDKHRTGTNPEDILSLFQMLKAKNERERKAVDAIYMEKMQHDKHIEDLQTQIDEVHKAVSDRMSDLEPEQVSLYERCSEETKEMKLQIDRIREDMEDLQARLSLSEARVMEDKYRGKFRSLQEQREQLLAKKKDLEVITNKDQKSPAEQRDQLLFKVKEDNAEIGRIEARSSEVKAMIENYKREIREKANDLEERKTDSGDQQKYELLYQKDQEMTAFIDSYEGLRREEVQLKTELEQSIVGLLEHMSRCMQKENSMPSVQQFSEMQEDVKFKKESLTNAQNTASRLKQELEVRKEELDKINTLDSKIGSELKSLNEKMAQMNGDIDSKFANPAKLRSEWEKRMKELQAQRRVLLERRDVLRQQVGFLQMGSEAKKKQLLENETHVELDSMEQKLKQYEQNVFHLRQFIESKGSESNYQAVLQNVNRTVEEINKYVIKIHQGGLMMM